MRFTTTFFKKLPAMGALAILLNCMALPSAAQFRIEVAVEHVKDTLGEIRVAVFSDAGTFLKKPVHSARVKAAKGIVLVRFEGIAPGSYAISIIHDANRNGKLDTNSIGIPREGFGFSNDAMGNFGPPSFDKAKVTITGSQRVTVNARYY